MRSIGLEVATSGSSARTAERHRRARGIRARPVAHVLRAHRHGGRRRACRRLSRRSIRDGRLYGRGAQDMKVWRGRDDRRGARRPKASGFRKGRLVVAAVVDEEYASIGADRLVREWKADARSSPSRPICRSVSRHKGFAWAMVETRGRAAHGSRPAEGRDAILRMGRVLARLERLDRELQARTPHPLLGTGSLHASIIEGGKRVEQLSRSVPAAARTPHGAGRERRHVCGMN